MPCLTRDLGPEILRVGEDWVETVTFYGDDGERFDLIGFGFEARLTDRFRPKAAPALVASIANGLVTIGDRNADGSVPLIIRAPAAQVGEALHEPPFDYRRDLFALRDGLCDLVATGLRFYRS